MAKIIQITDSVVTIGLDNGGIQEVRPYDLNFTPQIGDEVEIYSNENKVVVIKVQPKNNIPNGGININLQNVQSTDSQSSSANLKLVNKVAYCLLALFLGTFGAHKFYAGKTGTGIAFILFSWTCIPSIISFVDFIIGLCKKSDANGNILV